MCSKEGSDHIQLQHYISQPQSQLCILINLRSKTIRYEEIMSMKLSYYCPFTFKTKTDFVGV